MSINLHILKASGRLDPLEPQIRAAFDEAAPDIAARIPLPPVDVTVADNPDRAIPETGVGGYAPTAHLLSISIDPEHECIQEVIGSEIKSTLAHELHHCARWRVRGYGTTLLEAIISEGLADHFDQEMNGGEPSPWSTALQGDEFKRVLELAKGEFQNTEYDHSAWFFGTDKERIPRWSGYSLGYQIVGEYLKKTGKTAGELVSQDAAEFI